MDIEQYWQRNRRFVLQVAGGLLVFLVLNLFLARTVGRELRRAEGERASQTSKLRRLKSEGHPAAHQDLAEADFKALNQSIADFTARVDFEPDDAYKAALANPTPGAYLNAVTSVRDELLLRASRADLELESSLGLPEISPTRPEEIERNLEALDAIERIATAAIEAGVTRLDKIKIRLDPGLFGRRGKGALERTRIDLRLTGANGPLLRTLLATQRPLKANHKALMIESFQAVPERDRPDELRIELTLVVARLYDSSLLAPQE
jgi:hypothetical protein